MPPKILYFAPEDWAFFEHFSVTAGVALETGFRVAVATRIREHAKALADSGFQVIPLESERSNLGIIYNMMLIIRMARILREVKPDVVHCIGLRMVVLAGLASRIAGMRHVALTPTGLVHLWINNGLKERFQRNAIRVVVRLLLNRRNTEFIFENAEDPAEFGIPPDAKNLTIIGGVGVDPAEYPFVPEPDGGPIKVGVVARMVRGKGIMEAVAAVRIVRARGIPLELHLFGATDPSNRMTLTEADLRNITSGTGVYWHGRVSNVGHMWGQLHIAMLLSYREGLSRSLIEAAAAGRPIITTDVVGCRDIIRDQIEGFLVPKGDADQASVRLEQLATNTELRRRMGAAAHKRFSERFTTKVVSPVVRGVYRRIMDRLAT
ncbi:glycosyltransferase family 4 protein [Bradyrhizobium sp.]|uniref:glycosyltransferase family 4 protein n=1 Tax=Bradyrhizobium sp. TaxID=376 RepID=UPI004038156B